MSSGELYQVRVPQSPTQSIWVSRTSTKSEFYKVQLRACGFPGLLPSQSSTKSNSEHLDFQDFYQVRVPQSPTQSIWVSRTSTKSESIKSNSEHLGFQDFYQVRVPQSPTQSIWVSRTSTKSEFHKVQLRASGFPGLLPSQSSTKSNSEHLGFQDFYQVRVLQSPTQSIWVSRTSTKSEFYKVQLRASGFPGLLPSQSSTKSNSEHLGFQDFYQVRVPQSPTQSIWVSRTSTKSEFHKVQLRASGFPGLLPSQSSTKSNSEHLGFQDFYQVRVPQSPTQSICVSRTSTKSEFYKVQLRASGFPGLLPSQSSTKSNSEHLGFQDFYQVRVLQSLTQSIWVSRTSTKSEFHKVQLRASGFPGLLPSQSSTKSNSEHLGFQDFYQVRVPQSPTQSIWVSRTSTKSEFHKVQLRASGFPGLLPSQSSTKSNSEHLGFQDFYQVRVPQSPTQSIWVSRTSTKSEFHKVQLRASGFPGLLPSQSSTKSNSEHLGFQDFYQVRVPQSPAQSIWVSRTSTKSEFHKVQLRASGFPGLLPSQSFTKSNSEHLGFQGF